MTFARELSLKNLRRKPGRSAALVLLAAFLSFSVFGGSLIVFSLQRGLSSYSDRMGADIVVVPYEASTKGSLESILLQGIPGYFYMDAQYFEKVCATEGVAAASPQFFLASASAGCCSTPVQIIGFDPETDFSITPWIRESYSGSLRDGELIVGSSIAIPQSRTLKFYNTACTVVAQLGQTGTGLDTAVYTNMNTIRAMMGNAKALGFHYFDKVDPDRAVSSVMVKVADGYEIEQVTGDINIHVRHTVATQAQNMISDIAGGLDSVSRVIGVLIAVVWVLGLAILLVAFAMIQNERSKEFAVLRVAGASQKSLSRLLRTESLLISLIGALLGVGLACLVVFPFSSLIRTWLDLPYLLPGPAGIAALLTGAVLLSAAAGWVTAAFSSRRVSRSETGLLLRDPA